MTPSLDLYPTPLAAAAVSIGPTHASESAWVSDAGRGGMSTFNTCGLHSSSKRVSTTSKSALLNLLNGAAPPALACGAVGRSCAWAPGGAVGWDATQETGAGVRHFRRGEKQLASPLNAQHLRGACLRSCAARLVFAATHARTHAPTHT